MLGRMIPAATVQAHLQKIINASLGDDALSPAEIATLAAGEDMGLLTIDSRDADGTPSGITWVNL